MTLYRLSGGHVSRSVGADWSAEGQYVCVFYSNEGSAFKGSKPLTERQSAALLKRQARLIRMNGGGNGGKWYPCVGCCSGVRPWNQGSDYCSRCGR